MHLNKLIFQLLALYVHWLYFHSFSLLLLDQDGGDGSLDTFLNHGYQRIQLDATGPNGKQIQTEYAVSEEGTVAVIELALVSGIKLVHKEERCAKTMSTFGFGELIKHALDKEAVKKIILCLGGSASVDGGVGMAAALGYKFFGKNDEKEIKYPTGKDLINILRFEKPESKILNRINSVEFIIASDVSTPLLDNSESLGCVSLFSGQKGATDDDQILLNNGLLKYDDT